ncbi:uncharacterized protein LOC110834643 isoform X2 [Zootermopsis nevadensis]|nr:uncharacterized protein LOC110834643 isoform X2 [Zootermopsis nevadensis]
MEDITSPAKRSKQSTLIRPRHRGKVMQLCECPVKSSTTFDVKNSGKGSEECYCKTSAGKDGTHSSVTSQESEGSISPTHTDSDHHICKQSSELHSPKYNMNDGKKDNDQKRRTLESAHAIIDYSPQSIFLQRLKERFQAVGDLVAPANIRTTLAKPRSETSPKKSQYSGSTVQTNRMKPTKPSPDKTNLEKFTPLKFPPSARPHFSHGSHELISDGNKQSTTKQATRSPRHAYKGEMRQKKNRKRVCFRKKCHCRVQQNIQSKKRSPSATKENAQANPAEKLELTGPGDFPSSPCACFCDGSAKQMLRPKTPLIVSGEVEGLVDNGHDKKHMQPQCCCGRRSRWFDELNEFRQSHWFDCHAYPHPDSARNFERGATHPTGHKCVHEYDLDDRLFARPLYPDHENSSRCTVCHLPYSTSKSRTRETPAITLRSTLQNPEFQVSIPSGSPRGVRPSVSGNVLSHKKMTHAPGRGRTTSRPSHFTRTLGDLKPRAPVPADSLALRYQKGVAK